MTQEHYRGLREFSSLADRREYESVARDIAAQQLIDIISDVRSTDDLFVRPAYPDEDTDEADDVGDSAYDSTLSEWQLQITGSTSDDTGEYDAWAFDNDANMEDKTAVLYGYRHISTSGDFSGEPVSHINYRLPQGGLLARHQIQGITEGDDQVKLVEDPIVIRKTNIEAVANVVQDPADTNTATYRLQPLIQVAEEEDETFTSAPGFFTSGRR